jgi:hypothetical protein
MKHLIFTIALLNLFTGCATVNSVDIANSSPGFVTVVGPIFQGCNQNFTNVAQNHCAKFNKSAVFTSSQRIPIDGADFCSYECKR